MYCSKCGRQIPDGMTVCAYCEPEKVTAQQVYTPNQEPKKEEKKSLFNAPGKGGKSFAALFTAMLVFPATLCVAIDVVFDRYDYWFGYVVGALIVTWVIAVLPVLRITKPAVTGTIIFGAIMAYIWYISSKSGHLEWLTTFMLPMLILTAAFIAIDMALIGGKKLKGLHIISLLSLEGALYLVCLEATLDNLFKGAIDLKWSIIIACGFISVIAVMEAFN